VTQQPLTIGCCLSLTGPFARQGRQAEQGVRLWTETVNAVGGLLVGEGQDRRTVALVVRDDQGRVARAARLTEELIVDEQIDLLFGPYGSAMTLAAARVAETHRKVLWNHGGASDALVQRRFKYVVNILSPASHYFRGLLDLARATTPTLQGLFLVSSSRGTFGPAVIAGAAAYGQRLGMRVVEQTVYPSGDIGLLADRIATQQPDVLLGAGRFEDDVALARALRARSVAVPIVGLVAAGVADFGEQLGPAADGFFGPSQWEPSQTSRPDVGPTAVEFVTRFQARFGEAPQYPAAQAYAAGLIVEHCLEVAGTFDDAALLESTKSLRLQTFYGGFALDLTSGEQVGHDLVIVQWQNGAKRMVWPTMVAEAAPIKGIT
jgi:branched-chain amino acid transport system substrate-binding protein